jgi:hypothetical protein
MLVMTLSQWLICGLMIRSLNWLMFVQLLFCGFFINRPCSTRISLESTTRVGAGWGIKPPPARTTGPPARLDCYFVVPLEV